MQGKGNCQSVLTGRNEPRFKEPTLVVEVAAYMLEEKLVLTCGVSFLSTAFCRLLYKSSSAKAASIKSSLLKLNGVFGVVMVILVKIIIESLLYMKMRQLCQ